MMHGGATRLLVVVVAVSSTAWNVHTTAQVDGVPFPWVAALIALLPHAAAVAAALLLPRVSTWWRRAGLAYVAAFAALESVGLVQIVPFVSQFGVAEVAWSVATSSLALVAAVLAVLALRRMASEGETSTPGALRWTVVVAGLLLVASSMFAWTVTEHAPAGRWTFTLAHGSTGVLIGSLVGMAVVAGITAVVAASSERSLLAGATVGLLASRPLTPGIFADRTWQDADAMLAAGWGLALAAQLLLVIALPALIGRGAGASMAREYAPTS